MEGTRFGPWRILAELGSGGMGRVYRAEAMEAAAGLEVGTTVALKVIHPHLLAKEGAFKRFMREGRLGQQVEHENVVRTHDCDALLVDGSQQHFLVMEYVEGQTLRELLDELTSVPEELCRHIAREVTKGLAAIHALGAVHRDLKPENVLMTRDHTVKLMDLGVARSRDDLVRISQTGAFVGSLPYAAPEQFRLGGASIDGRADLHALGVVLYELATGIHPFRDEDASTTLRKVLELTPAKLGQLDPQLSAFFEEVVHRLLAKDADDRFPTALGLSAVLEEGESSAWWVARAGALQSEDRRPVRRMRLPRETAVDGRDAELAVVHRAFEQARKGVGGVLLVEGEAGIGKSRIVDEALTRLEKAGEDLSFLVGSYPPGGAATAVVGFGEAFREYLGEAGSGP